MATYFLFCLVFSCVVNAQSISPEIASTTPLSATSSISAYIAQKAQENGISTDLALYVAEHESGFDCSQIGDMNIFKKGKPVRARGCWQITEYYHPEVSDKQAFDLEWSTNWSLKYLKNKKDCIAMWTECRNYYKIER